MTAPRFEDVVPSPDALMGVKAVFGPLRGRAVCFSSRGNAAAKDRSHFRSARIAAEYAVEQPFLIAIGGGAHVRDDLGGHVLNVARVSKVYGETPVFYTDPDEVRRLAQWPVATALLDVYQVDGLPHLVDDLGLPDRTILANAFDIVVRPPDKVAALWEALRGRTLSLPDVPPLPNFREPEGVTLVGSLLPKKHTGEEGRRIAREVQLFERRSDLAREARRLNREANGGSLVCECCTYSDNVDGMFDVHHLVPLMLGVRETTLSDLAVLCPLCHRWAHKKGGGQTDPLPLAAVRAARRVAGGSPPTH